MTPYVWRLCCLSLAVLFVVQVAAGLALRMVAPRLVQLAGCLDSSRAAHLMLALRWMPSFVGGFVAVCLCAPAYLQLEPTASDSDEQIGRACAWLAALAVLSYLLPAGQVLYVALRSELRLRALLLNAEERSGLYVIRETAPAMALAGLWQARVVVSREVVQLLPADQMDAARRHEQAHRESRDNWKRLVLEAAPVALCGDRLRMAWSRFAEWAADDRATAGDAASSVALASALVSVARLGSACLPGASALVSDGCDLRMRVERLLEPRVARAFPGSMIGGTVLVLGVALIIVAQQPGCAEILHGLLESLVDSH